MAGDSFDLAAKDNCFQLAGADLSWNVCSSCALRLLWQSN